MRAKEEELLRQHGQMVDAQAFLKEELARLQALLASERLKAEAQHGVKDAELERLRAKEAELQRRQAGQSAHEQAGLKEDLARLQLQLSEGVEIHASEHGLWDAEVQRLRMDDAKRTEELEESCNLYAKKEES
ncbi:unnamed protein product [Effrenium voratum]|nr:unnamed protein product [Effrenium voratum]